MDPTASPKAYCSTLETFLNNKRKPCVPPIYHNNNYITDFKEKAQIFNNFFAKQCTLVENTSKLSTDFLMMMIYRLLMMILQESLKILI